MKYFLLTLAAALLLASPGVDAADVPFDTVRAISDVDGNKFCSAVVVAPGAAMTARHCLKRGMRVDGIPAAYVTVAAPENRDIGVAYVPGLACPCAALGKRPAIGDQVVAVGFPEGGERRVTASAAVKLIDSPLKLAPWIMSGAEAWIGSVYILTDAPITKNGDSGGGLFAVQDGTWKLIGINGIGVPAAPDSRAEQSSGAMPVDLAAQFLPKELQ
jgi:trypsin-like peptidase